MARNSLIYKKDFSPFLKIVKTDFQAIDEKQSRCFVAVGIPLEVIQKEYVRQFQKQKDMASVFAKSETYRYLLKLSGVEAIPAQSKPKKESIKKQESKKNKVTGHKYDADITPAWFNISYNNKKVMVNQTATAESEKESLAQAIANCNKAKMKIADNFVRAEIEKYRKLSQYDEIKFAKIKNKASKEVSQLNYPITKEFVKTIQLGKNSYKSYVQYSLNKKSLQSTLIKVLKEDEVLYSRLRASMSFDELEDDDF